MTQSFVPTGKGKDFVVNGEFVLYNKEGLIAAATEFLKRLEGKPEMVDTGFMGIEGPLLADVRDAGIDHERCGYPRVIKFRMTHGANGDIAHLLYSFDLFDTQCLTNMFKLHARV